MEDASQHHHHHHDDGAFDQGFGNLLKSVMPASQLSDRMPTPPLGPHSRVDTAASAASAAADRMLQLTNKVAGSPSALSKFPLPVSPTLGGTRHSSLLISPADGIEGRVAAAVTAAAQTKVECAHEEMPTHHKDAAIPKLQKQSGASSNLKVHF